MRSRLAIFALTLIMLVGLGLRVVKLDKFTVSLSMDEAAVAYNAYSILKTGKDEFGTPFPLSFRSIGDYKSPLLIYTIVPAIATFGLTEFGTRITIALIGTLTILLVYFLIKLLSSNETISLLTALSVAISPWHIKPSRLTHDVVLGLFLVILGAVIFLISVKYKKKFFWLAAIIFGLSLYAYHVEKVFTPLFVLGICIIFGKELLSRRKETIVALIAGAIITLPLIFITITPEGRTRANMTFLTKDVEINSELNKPSNPQDTAGMIFNNNFLKTFNFWSKRYLDYLDPNLLFINGMGFTLPNSPDVGYMYLFELPFGLFGIYLIWVKRKVLGISESKVILLWLILGPLAASLANNAKHHFRSLTLIPIWQLFFAIGVWQTFLLLKNNLFKQIFLGFLVGAVLFSVVYFSDLYFVQYQLSFSEYFMDGWKSAIQYALANQDKYSEINLDSRYGTLGPYTIVTPHVYLLFYGKVDPETYHKDPGRLVFGQFGIKYRNFDFDNIDWTSGKDLEKTDTLFIGSPWVLPAKDSEILQKFYLYNGKEILRAVNPKNGAYK